MNQTTLLYCVANNIISTAIQGLYGILVVLLVHGLFYCKVAIAICASKLVTECVGKISRLSQIAFPINI